MKRACDRLACIVLLTLTPGWAAASLQDQIDAAWRAGGGEVVVPAGEHRLTPIRLRSGVRLRLARGAHVYGVRDCAAYVGAWTRDALEPIALDDLRHAAGEDLTRRSQYALFTAFRAHDIEIVGEEGSFICGENCPDAQGAEWYRGPHVFSFACSTNVVFRGVSVRDSGDYAFRFLNCQGVTADGVSARGGHDGIHFDLCSRVRVLNADFRTGDDAVAGSGCLDVVVSNCVLNSACSPFRLGGRNVLVTDCRATGPAEYPHRWTLSRKEKLDGAPAPAGHGRRTVGCFYQAYTGDVAHRGFRPGNIVVRNTVVENAERFLLSVSGLPSALWQDGHGIADITFENVRATGLGLPAAVVAKADEPMTVTLKDCSFSFREPQACAFFGKDVKVVDKGVRLQNARRLFDERPNVSYDDVPEFPSWRVEPSEQRAKWGLPPLRTGKREAAILETKPICVEPGRYIGWPTICRRASGELLVVFSGDRDQHVCPWGKVQLIRSSDDGRTWSKPVTIQNGIIDDRDAGLIELKDGTLLLNWFTSIAFAVWNKDEPGDRGAGAQYVRHFKSLPREQVRAALGAWTARSTDGGLTWSKAVRTPGQLPHGVTELRDGRIVAVARQMANEGQVLDDEPGFDKIGHHILCEESRDGGRSWQVIGELEPGEGVTVDKLHEPHLAELPDGRLLAQVRWHGVPVTNRWGGIVQAESRDGGRTWTKMVKTPIVGFPPHLLTLADGRLLTVYGNRNRDCWGEYACLSEDGGRTWDVAHEICLSRHANGDLGYPSSVQLADGTILTVYYQAPTPDALPAVMMTRWRLP